VLVTAGRLLLATAIVALVGAAAHLPLGETAGGAALRLALRTQLARTETCRDRSDAELAALPAHMRVRRVCTEVAATYRLRVTVDGRPRVDRLVAHSGVRHNRPLVVDEVLAVDPGDRRVEIRFAPEGEAAASAALPAWELAGTVTFPAGRIRIASLRDEKLAWLSDSVAPR
jgi:hypothetical protein